ncbi:hypothetical protein EVJ58_g4390 [Rhodofomes roseus]|uniref:Uncharacterized protein n=1 Tax=Rhodofomes roseus TaxID=34475 RepID=A0A4Y9YJ65_9APHY|nr:hypothetical protein EVJ58_g4390 [Rhodofomes roseus]
MPSAIATSTARARTLNADIWYAGKGQYSEGGGGSSCGLAALNCARVVLGLERKEPQDGNILDIMVQHDTTEEILRPCASWSSATHLDVDDIYRTPIFNKSLKLLHTSFGRPKVQEFKHVLARLAQTTRTTGASASVVITRPPEIISCLKLVTMTGGADSFVVYDSHPRPEHPDGAAFIVFQSLDNAATYIARLMNYDESLLADDDTQWQVQYLAQFSAHIFAARPMPFTAKELEDATLEASLDILNLKAKASELESQKENLLADQMRLTSRVAVLEDELTELREQNWRQLRRDDKRPRFGGLFKDSDQGADDARARSFSTKRGLGRLYTSIVPNDAWREGWYDSPRCVTVFMSNVSMSNPV